MTFDQTCDLIGDLCLLLFMFWVCACGFMTDREVKRLTKRVKELEQSAPIDRKTEGRD
jgi:hypothetical protein